VRLNPSAEAYVRNFPLNPVGTGMTRLFGPFGAKQSISQTRDQFQGCEKNSRNERTAKLMFKNEKKTKNMFFVLFEKKMFLKKTKKRHQG
jgi:hypothetical protein